MAPTEPFEPLDPAAATAASLLAGQALPDQGGQAGASSWPGLVEVTGLVEQAAADQDVQATIGEISKHPDEPTRSPLHRAAERVGRPRQHDPGGTDPAGRTGQR